MQQDQDGDREMVERVWLLVAAAMLLMLILAVPVVLTWKSSSEPPIILAVFTAAILGSLVHLSDRTGRNFKRPNWRHIAIVFSLKLLASCALALFAFIFFMSGFLQGPLFPAFQQVDSEYTNFVAFANDAKPSTNLDAAKLMVWAFVAGYSERFVVKLIRRLESKAGSEQ